MDSRQSPLNSLLATAREAERSGNLEIAASAWKEIRLQYPESSEGFTFGGCLLKRLGQLSEALSVFGQGLDRFPKNEWLAVEQAWAFIDLGDFATAAQRWQDIRLCFPNNLGGYLGGGLAHRRMGDYNAADDIYRAALSRLPDTLNVFADFAWNAEEKGDLPEAIQRWHVVQSRFPDVENGYVRAGVLLLNSEHWDEADDVLAEAVRRFPDSVDAMTSYAWVAQNRGHWPEALKRWEMVLHRFPQLRDPRRLAAQVLMELGRFEDAKNVLAPALRMFPDDRDIVVLSGWMATRRRDIEAAERIWGSVRERYPENVDGYLGHALALRDVNRLNEAEVMLTDASRRFPENSLIAMDLAHIPELRKNWSLASERWRRVMTQFPDLPAAYIGLGNSLGREGDMKEAEATYSAGKRRFPDDIALGAAQASLSASAGDWVTALARWKTLRQRFPGNPLGYLGLARTLRGSGELSQSLEALSEALQRFPENMELEIQLALTLSAKREWPTALARWESLKKRFPNHSDVRSGIAQILDKALSDQAAANTVAFSVPSALLAADVDDSEYIRSLSVLFKRFESLGDTCEFGMVQRIFQADQVSLLRWAATSPENLVKALDTRFDGVGDPEHTIISINGDEYTTEDRRYSMHSHTFTSPAAEPIEFFVPEQCRRIQWLRGRLLDNLASASRIFVYKHEEGLTVNNINSLYAALCRYCPETALLCVNLEEPGHDSGTVEKIRDGLFVGYIDKFSTVDISVNAWITLCRRVTSYLPVDTNRVQIRR